MKSISTLDRGSNKIGVVKSGLQMRHARLAKKILKARILSNPGLQKLLSDDQSLDEEGS